MTRINRNCILLATVLCGVVAAHSGAQGPLGSSFSYQGQLQEAGAPFDGMADFDFSLWDAEVDGSQIDSTVTLLDVAVTEGVFTVGLDFGVDALNGEERWLEISVNATLLAPRQRLAGTPYALQTRGLFVDDAGNLGIGTTSPSDALHIFDGDLTADRGSATNDRVRRLTLGGAEKFDNVFAEIVFNNFDSTNGNVDYTGAVIAAWNRGSTDDGALVFSVTEDMVLSEAMRIDSTGTVIINSSLVVDTDTLFLDAAAGNVGIGTATPTSLLDVAGTATATAFVGDGSGLTGINVNDADADPANELQDLAGVLGQGNDAGGAAMHNLGNVGIGTPATVFPLTFDQTLGDKISLWGQDGAHYGFGVQGSLLQIHSNTVIDDIAFGYGESSDMTEVMRIKGSGNVGIGTAAPDVLLHIEETGDGEHAMLKLQRNETGTGANQQVTFYLDPTNDVFTLDVGGAGNSTARIHLGDASSSDNNVTMLGNVGIGTDAPLAKLDVRGTTRTEVIELTGGADIAEPFEVLGAAIKPGMVVSIDPKHAGALRVSDQAYDMTVAGVISGAGDVQPGMVLSDPSLKRQNMHQVALTGRVWVWCDAEANGAIAPGNLLTTSSSAGHAMRATNSDRTQGAVIGKAMSSLDAGRGLVLVLVSLQ